MDKIRETIVICEKILKPHTFNLVCMPNSTNNHTAIYSNDDLHEFRVIDSKNSGPLATIKIQKGATKEVGVNGVFVEDLLNIALYNLEQFQDSPMKCEDNDKAIDYINKALEILRERTNKRIERGVIGTEEL